MKVIKDNHNVTTTYTNNPFPLNVICDHCGSELELEEDDCYIGALGAYHYTCPCCGEEVMLDEPDGIVLTTENIEFPTHFYHYCYESTYPTPEEIKDNIRGLISYHRNHKDDDDCPYTVCNAGRSLYVVEKALGDKTYYVSVAPNYYSVQIPFTEEDYSD